VACGMVGEVAAMVVVRTCSQCHFFGFVDVESSFHKEEQIEEVVRVFGVLN